MMGTYLAVSGIVIVLLAVGSLVAGIINSRQRVQHVWGPWRKNYFLYTESRVCLVCGLKQHDD